MESLQNNTLQEQIAALPLLPGVYRFYDATHTLLYVGKARSLKRRISSYFTRTNDGTRIGHMVGQIAYLETTVVRSETEALLLENNLIKTLQPRCNILFRDDKSYPYLRLTGIPSLWGSSDAPWQQFPRLSYYRGAVDKKNTYFGPFPHVSAVRESVELLQRVFKLRTCEDAFFSHRSRPCLMYQIKRCSAPCIDKISAHDYHEQVQHAVDFLRGHTRDLLDRLQTKMLAESEALAFEAAAFTRDQIAALALLLQQQSVENIGDRDADVLAVHVAGGRACVNVALVRGGRHLGDKAYFPAHTLDTQWLITWEEDDGSISIERNVLQAFVQQHYTHTPPPTLLICKHGLDESVIQWLETLLGKKLHLVTQPREHRKAWLDMAQQNAELALTQRLTQEGSARSRTEALAQVLHLDTQTIPLETLRIECFDVSHTSGEATVASCVVYTEHAMQSKAYRRYNITDIQASDDYAAMKQVLQRRYENWRNRDDLPHIVLIDGGQGQIHAARLVFDALGLDITRLVGVEKGEGRRVGLEELVFADGRPKLTLPPQSAALMLIAHIRDEAHRFAITGMRAKRAKARTGSSSLEDIPNIGPKRRAELFNHFGGIRGLKAASKEDIAQVPGISKTLAQTLFDHFR